MTTRVIRDAYGWPYTVTDAGPTTSPPSFPPSRGYSAKRGKVFPPAPGCWGKSFNGDNRQCDPNEGQRILDEAKGSDD